MSVQTWHETHSPVVVADGPTLTTGTAASMLPTGGKVFLPNNFFYPGKLIRVIAWGRISNVVTTPGTARFDLRLGGTVVWDSGAVNLNVNAKTNVPWYLELDLRCRTFGAVAGTTFMGIAQFQSEALIGAAVPTAGGNSSLLVPVGAPVVGAGVDGTAALAVDMFFTQTVTTGSLTAHEFEFLSRN